MTEYEKKVEEVKELCVWFNEHMEQVLGNKDCFLIAIVHNERLTECGIGETITMMRVIDSVLSHQVEKEVKVQ